MMFDIFISYASTDRPKVKQIAIALENKGWTVWWDRKIPPGKTFAQVIENAITNSKCIVVLWSPASVKSEWVQLEAAEGIDRKILVPAIIENAKPPFRFKRIHAANLINWSPNSKHDEFDSFANSIATNIKSFKSEENKSAEKIPKEINPIEKFEFLTTPIEMVFVKGGTFDMGSNDGSDDEKPIHPVTLPDFYIGKYEVTQKQWTEIMGNNPSHFKDCDDCPVENVSWDDVQEFLKKLIEKTGQNYRLPTEAEWEYAARGGISTGSTTYAGSNNIEEVAWYYENSNNKTHPVGQKKPNELGIFDMSGNVWEWCCDRYDKDYYQNSPENNPQGPSVGSSRVLRGGSWISDAVNCRMADRSTGMPVLRSNLIGLRLLFALQFTS